MCKPSPRSGDTTKEEGETIHQHGSSATTPCPPRGRHKLLTVTPAEAGVQGFNKHPRASGDTTKEGSENVALTPPP